MRVLIFKKTVSRPEGISKVVWITEELDVTGELM